MTLTLQRTAIWMLLAIATATVPALAQNAAPAPAGAAPAPAATAATGYGGNAQAPANRRARNRNNEQKLLGAPRQYSLDDAPLGKAADAQQALLDEQRMTVLGGGQGGKPALGKGKPQADKAPANGQVRVAGKAGRANAADSLMPEGAARNAYADPYGTGKHAVYRSPW
ncbi:MAG TPA: hypothetical protein VEN30_06560 [Paraburkholderia sp.]|nr:hypothetical protein [Paraburkholderia sp.]